MHGVFTPEHVAVTQSLFLSGWVLKLAVTKNLEEQQDRHERSWLNIESIRQTHFEWPGVFVG